MGKKINLGRVSLVFKDEYNPNERYDELDAVTHNGSTWVCLNPIMNVEPGTDGKYWHILGAQGAQGIAGQFAAQGVQGNVGAQGADGAQGAQGADGTQGSQGVQGVQGITGSGTQGAQGADGHSPVNTEQWSFLLANGTTLNRTIYMVPQV